MSTKIIHSRLTIYLNCGMLDNPAKIYMNKIPHFAYILGLEGQNSGFVPIFGRSDRL
jgi:hypothetical protein